MAGERTTRPDLLKLLDNSPAPIYMVDEDRRIIFCNAACGDWLGVKAEVLLGQQCVYHAPPADRTPGAIACELCPPPKALAGQAQAAVIVHVLPNGQIARRGAHFLPLGDGGDECAEILAILETHERPGGASASVVAEDARLHEEVRLFRTQMAGQFGTDTLIGSSHGAVKVRSQVELAAQTRSAVLILGPPGTGKDHVAKAIHYGQPEPGTLLPLECAIVETNLLRSTLRALDLRHSVTKDLRTTLLLHDIDAATPEVQADLVEILRLHARTVRAIATAGRPLVPVMGERHFLPHLASALSTLVIELAPLAQRLEDLPLLAQVFLEEANVGSAKQVGSFSSEALDRLVAYPWPGNLDELASIVRRSHEAAQGGEVAARELPNEIHWAAQAAAHPARAEEAIVLEEFLARVELELVTRALKLAKGNKTKAARLLGMTRPRLYRRLVQLGLEQPRNREPERSG